MPKIEKNKITFIIPSVNRDTLTNSINSLLNQTNKNWKCIKSNGRPNVKPWHVESL